MRPVRRKDFGLDLVLRFISISFKYMSLLFFPSVSFFVPFWSLSLEIYTIPIIEFIFLNQRRIHDFNTLSYRFFFLLFITIFLLRSMAHFILSFYLVLSASAFVLTNQYELKFSSIGAERERERKCKKVKCKE